MKIVKRNFGKNAESIEEEIDCHSIRIYLKEDNREFAIEIGSSNMGDDHVQIRAVDRQLVIKPSLTNCVSITVENWSS